MLAATQPARTLRGYVVLGAYPRRTPGRNLRGDCCGLDGITADQAAETAMPKSAIRSTPGFTQAVYDGIVTSAEGGRIAIPGACSSGSGSSTMNDLALVQKGTGLALTGATIGLTATGVATAAALAPFTLGISAVVGLLPMLFQHHAAAVAKERQVDCALIPAANNYLNIIDQAVSSGQQTPQEGIAALKSLLSDFKSQIASVTKNSSSQCNAGCVYTKDLEAIVAYRVSLFQDLAAQQATKITSGNAATPGAVSSGSTLTVPAAVTALTSSLPSWWPIAAIAVVAILVSKVL